MKKIVNTRKGFTLAEILISLVILGVIAALTIPTLIQNTHKKEEVVKIKKGLSMINQALALNYVHTGKYIENYADVDLYSNDNPLLNDIFRGNMSTVKIVDIGSDYHSILTQDGLCYIVGDVCGDCYDDTRPLSDSNYAAYMEIRTKDPNAEVINYGGGYEGTVGNLNGVYYVYCGHDKCVPSENTAAIINASDPTKVDSGS